MTEFLFRSDSYAKSTPARIVEITPEGGIVLDRTVFYATSGGQPGDSGALIRSDGSRITIATAIHPGGDKSQIAHVPGEGAILPEVGETLSAEIDWERR